MPAKRVERTIYSILVLVAAVVAIVQWQRAELFEHENAELRLRIEALEGGATDAAEVAEAVRMQTERLERSERLRKESTELMQLRTEVTQLRGASGSNVTMAAENRRLKTELAELKLISGVPDSSGQKPRMNTNEHE